MTKRLAVISLSLVCILLFSGCDIHFSAWETITEPVIESINVPAGYRATVFVDRGFSEPGEMAMDRSGNLYVGGTWGGYWDPGPLIQVSPTGAPIRFTQPIQDPDGVAVGPDDTVYVAGASTITEVASNGSTSTYRTGFTNLNGLEISHDGKMYILENSGDVIEMSEEGTMRRYDTSANIDILSFGCLTPDERFLLLDDPQNGRVMRLNLDSGELYEEYRHLTTPHGMAFSRSGELFIADSGTGEVLRVGSDGNLQIFATGFSRPTDLLFGLHGDLYVAEQGKARIVRISGFDS